MNYILKLKSDLVEREKQLLTVRQQMETFHAFLHSEKFTGTQADGSRKDWIATGDVINWLQEVRRAVAEVGA